MAASVAAIVALPYAAYQVRQARINASATAAATIFSNIKLRIDEVARHDSDQGLYEATCGLLNEIEFSCSLYLDSQLGGHTGKIATEFIKDILAAIEKNDKLLGCAVRAIHKPHTFECIKQFCRKHKNDWKPLSAA
ncbi:hypothetical protein CN150_04075 [Sinorhizobium meliloti]|uniref:hypothetical protein n=1 Tax=Rhizobium meliloti TaxID=382 RepID=UPI000FE13707|nr:hypothetical protein [Sinorhizobium meliloti]RVL00184.1 hypothetical protein CN150_04075 [Sinorhizobium meliloti]